MSSHFSVACPTHFSVPWGAWRHTLAPKAAGATCPFAHIRPWMQTAPYLAQSSAVCKRNNYIINLCSHGRMYVFLYLEKRWQLKPKAIMISKRKGQKERKKALPMNVKSLLLAPFTNWVLWSSILTSDETCNCTNVFFVSDHVLVKWFLEENTSLVCTWAMQKSKTAAKRRKRNAILYSALAATVFKLASGRSLGVQGPRAWLFIGVSSCLYDQFTHWPCYYSKMQFSCNLTACTFSWSWYSGLREQKLYNFMFNPLSLNHHMLQTWSTAI